MIGPQPKKICVVCPTWQPHKADTILREMRSYTASYYSIVYAGVYTGSATSAGLQNIMHVDNIRRGPVEAMAIGVHRLSRQYTPDLWMFVHDDFHVLERGWDEHVISVMEGSGRPIGLAGFHGALGLGSSDIYETPYELTQLARYAPMSNMRDAELHGSRITSPTQVATVDGFAMVFDSFAYARMKGWRNCLEDGIIFHMYDNWAAARMVELGLETWMIPVECHHEGGGTEVALSGEYEEWCWRSGFTDGSQLHKVAHEVFYGRFKNVLPIWRGEEAGA